MQFRGGTDKFHASRKAIDRYGPTAGCPVCTSIIRKWITIGRVGVHHNDTCRERVANEMKKDSHYRKLMQKHQGNISTVQGQNTLEEQRCHIRKVSHPIQQELKKIINNITDQLGQAMMRRMVASMDVAEFYSPPRMAEMAAKMGFRAGWSIDITTQDI